MKRGDVKGKLNIFQRTILLWNEIHPYNAVHVVRVPQPLNVMRLKDIIDKQIESHGLTGLVMDRGEKTFHYHGGPANIGIRVIEKQGDVFTALCNEIQEQLNMPFAVDARISPFRFFAVAEDNSFYFGLVYFHIIASADSIVYILKNILNSYLDTKASLRTAPLNLYQESYRYLLPKIFKYLPKWILTFPGHVANLRKSFRPGYSDFNDHNVGFSYFSIGAPHFDFLCNTAKRWGVTLNDMFLALLLKSLSPISSKRMHAARRKKISVASIVNIRKDLSPGGTELFGLFLSSFRVSHTVPDGIDIERLVKDVHGQTEKIKKYKVYLQTIVEMGISLALISSFFKKQQKKFYSKYYPLCGGITNINLNALWGREGDKIPIDYFRAVSTGLATPLVFSFTTVNNVLNIGVSFRTTVFSMADIGKIISDFSNYIYSLKGNPR